MRKRMIYKNFVRSLLAVGMAISLAMPALEPLAVKAADTKTEAELSQEVTAENQSVESFEDAFARFSFYDLQMDGILQVSGGAKATSYEKSTQQYYEEEDPEKIDRGALISAEAKDVATAKVTFTKTFDFGNKVVDRVCINALAKRASDTKFQIYVNDQEFPACSAKLYNQVRSDNWDKKKALSVDLSAAKITGQCKITIQFATDGKEAGVNEDLEVLLRDMQFTEESIPVVELNIDESKGSITDMNNDILHNTECYGKMSIHVPESYKAPYGGSYTGGTYELDYIRGRGNSTWGKAKKPYHIKLDKNANLFNMGKNKHWLLIANYLDNSLVRNRMTYWLGEKLGYAYTPKCLNVDLVMNGEYLGNYLLCEQIRVDENRLDITDLEKAYEKAENPEDVDISGGYFLSMSPYGDEYGYGFEAQGNEFYINSPESKYDTPLFDRLHPDFNTNRQAETDSSDKVDEKAVTENHGPYEKANKYIENYVKKVADAIYAEDFKTEDGISYAELMDVDSAVAYYWMQEFSLNQDFCNTSSTYLYKEADVKDAEGNVIENGKLYWGPLWDFDYVAWASNQYGDYDNESTYYQGFRRQLSWFEMLMRDPAFVKKIKAYWYEEFKPAMEDVIADGGLLDQYKEELAVSAKNNFDKWNYTYLDEGAPDDVSHAWEIDRLKNWISHRIKWIDENVENIAPKHVNVIFKNGDEVIYESKIFTNDYLRDFPETPSKEGYTFLRWVCDYTNTDEDEAYTEQMVVDMAAYITDEYLDKNDDLVIYATYIANEEIIDVDEVIFDHKNYCTYYDDHMLNGFPIEVLVLPEDATFAELNWKSSDENVATVDDANVSINGIGETTISAITQSGKEYSVLLRVTTMDEYLEIKEMDDEMDQTDITLMPGKGQKLNIGHGPECFYCPDINDAPYFWKTLNPEVADVDTTGYVTAVGPGQTSILAINSANGTLFTCTVTVEEENVEPAPEPAPSVKVGEKFTSGNLKYSVTACKDSNLQAQVIGKVKSKKTVSIPATVTYQKKKFKVTAIKASAFAKDKKITSVYIGKNVKKIGSKAFYKCKNLKKVKIYSKVLKSVGKQAFSGISKKAKIYVPKGMKKKYKKFFKNFTVK